MGPHDSTKRWSRFPAAGYFDVFSSGGFTSSLLDSGHFFLLFSKNEIHSETPNQNSDQNKTYQAGGGARAEDLWARAASQIVPAQLRFSAPNQELISAVLSSA